jgi:hypothetical protein
MPMPFPAAPVMPTVTVSATAGVAVKSPIAIAANTAVLMRLMS